MPVSVEVIFALPDHQELVTVSVDDGSTVQQAIDRCGISAQFPDHDLQRCAVGIWGRPVGRQDRLDDGDRIELYRELQIEPREARRRLARAGKTMRRYPTADGSGSEL
jgi:putative ubiquitin-RnfH superfamily antitoxin RatB of RatAB toxin-antitoxin module